MAQQQPHAVENREHILLQYLDTRERSLAICAPLKTEDYVIQTMPDVSPPKWHLAHTSWFFETFLLGQFDSGYKPFHPLFDELFNSYYVTHGRPFPRPQRGFLSRPTVEEVMAYRAYVDKAMQHLIHDVSESRWLELSSLVILGINHEQQHQELLLTDIKHILAFNPLKPAYRDPVPVPREVTDTSAVSWSLVEGGTVSVGHAENDMSFTFDNESPAHKVYLDDFRLASRCVINRDYIEFMEDGGYDNAGLWLSDGWSTSQQQDWRAPLYWEKHDGEWFYFSFEGFQKVDLDAPVCHVSYFEADAYATWADRRLPTEHEWELAAAQIPVSGNLFEQDPGYRPASGAIGEYNGKFMSSQMVLRGGSFATAKNHIRATYRNFFYPKDRWQFSGIRLAD